MSTPITYDTTICNPLQVLVDDTGVLVNLNPDMRYVAVHSGYKSGGTTSSAILQLNGNIDPLTPPTYDPFVQGEGLAIVSPGGPGVSFGPLIQKNPNVFLIADTGDEAIVSIFVLHRPVQF